MEKGRSFLTRYGPWALIAGASTGIGAAYARHLVQRGLNLVLVARGRERLEALAQEVRTRYAVGVRAIAIALGAETLLTDLLPQIDDLEIGLLVCNSGHSDVREISQSSREGILAIFQVNCRGPLLLCHDLGGKIAARGRGGVIRMSSMAGLQGTGMIVDNAATKAFDIVLAEGLWEEWRHQGVDVLAVVAGTTRTPTVMRRINPDRLHSVPSMHPEAVAREAPAPLGKGPRRVIDTFNKWGGPCSWNAL